MSVSHPYSGHSSDSRTKSAKSIKSAKSTKSEGSRATSISVTLPTANPDHDLARKSPVTVRSLSPERHRHGSSHSGTMRPQVTPTMQKLTDREIARIVAARILERTWLSFRDRQMFKLLKHAICAAEHSLSYEILRKVSPLEAHLLKDKCMQAKVRFRFGGSEFPPLIYFKIYTSTNHGQGVKYVSGRKMIQPASMAARDACDLMGNRKFYDQMIEDMLHHESHRITDEIDVTTLKDYMQYMSILDETPANMGGKDNNWRKLTLEVLPRQTIFYDVVAFLYSHQMSSKLQKELPALLAHPLTQDVQVEHIRIISELRPVSPPNVPAPRLPAPSAKHSGRRSKQAQNRALKMKQMYAARKQQDTEDGAELVESQLVSSLGQLRTENYEGPEAGQDADVEDGNLDEEADKLYEWTQELSYDDLAMTPRVGTGRTSQLTTTPGYV